jgi:hypothetical protein
METHNDRLDIKEKLSATDFVGGGSLGMVPFEVFSLKDTDIGTRLSSSFENIRNTQPQSVFTESKEIREQLASDNILFILKDSHESSLIETFSPDTFVIHGPTDSEAFIKRLPHLFYNLAERMRQETLGLVTAHAAAVAKDGRGILILGDKGSGKTSLMLALCLTQGFEMIGNDSIVLGGKEELVIATGSHQINVRLPVARKLNLPMRDTRVVDNKINYEIKFPFLPEELGIKTTDRILPLSAVVRINLHSDNSDFVVSNIPSHEVEALRLSENFSRYIRGIPTPLELSNLGIRGHFPDLDTIQLTGFRNEIINTLLSKESFLYIAGNNPITTAEKLGQKLNLP